MPPIRPMIGEMEDQRISAVSNLAIGDADVIPPWFGESDLATPGFIRTARGQRRASVTAAGPWRRRYSSVAALSMPKAWRSATMAGPEMK